MTVQDTRSPIRTWARGYAREIVFAACWVVATLLLAALSGATGLTFTDNVLLSGLLAVMDFNFVLVSLDLRAHARTQSKVESALLRDQEGIDSVIRTSGRTLNPLTHRAVLATYQCDTKKVQTMLEEGKYLVERNEWYLETIRLCLALRELDEVELMAVSAYNIEDFANDEDAKRYLAANVDAAKHGTCVRRLFILDPADLESHDIRHVLVEHDKQLGNRVGKAAPTEPAVKWMLRRHAHEVGVHDFALFYPHVIVRQTQGSRNLDVSQIGADVEGAAADFRSLWEHQSARPVAALLELKGKK